MSTWQSVTDLLAGIPELPGAACKRRADLYERTVGEHQMTGQLTRTEVEDARREALRLCAGCCAALECRAWLDTLPRSRRPAGVVAGLVITADGKPSRQQAEPDRPTVQGEPSA